MAKPAKRSYETPVILSNSPLTVQDDEKVITARCDALPKCVAPS